METETNPISTALADHDILHNVHIPKLKVLGLGGGGSNAIERMMECSLRGVEFIAANTDHQALAKNPAPTKILLGPNSTRGLGAGGDPRKGHLAADESREAIREALAGADMVFLTAGMGGGTGTGSIPVAAEIARELGATVIAIVTTPFSFEMGKRQKNTHEGLDLLRQHTHTLVTIPNDKLLYVAPRNLPIEVAFRLADDVLRQAVQGISELIYEPGLINVDYAHIQRLTRLGGGALMSIGQGSGSRKIHQALEQALHHPLLDDIHLGNAAGIIVNFTCGEDLSLVEMDEEMRQLQALVGDQTEIIMGVVPQAEMGNRVQVILMITGLGSPTLEETFQQVKRSDPLIQQPAEIKVETKPPFISYLRPEEDALYETARPSGKDYTQPSKAGVESGSMRQNLDVPAFLRKRSRLFSNT